MDNSALSSGSTLSVSSLSGKSGLTGASNRCVLFNYIPAHIRGQLTGEQEAAIVEAFNIIQKQKSNKVYKEPKYTNGEHLLIGMMLLRQGWFSKRILPKLKPWLLDNGCYSLTTHPGNAQRILSFCVAFYFADQALTVDHLKVNYGFGTIFYHWGVAMQCGLFEKLAHAKKRYRSEDKKIGMYPETRATYLLTDRGKELVELVITELQKYETRTKQILNMTLADLNSMRSLYEFPKIK